MAHNAEVPIYIAFADYWSKECGLHGKLQSAGTVEQDMAQIKNFYSGVHGCKSENFNT
jgi:hypothetical protein